MTSQVPITYRSVPLVSRQDLIQEDIKFRGEKYRAVKDPLALRYYHLQPQQCLVLDSLDGNKSLEEIRGLVQRHFPTQHVTNSDIQSLILDCHRKELVVCLRAGQADVLHLAAKKKKWTRMKQSVLNPLFIKFPGWNPAQQLTHLTACVGWIFARPTVIASAVLVLASWIQLAVRFDELRLKVPAFEQFFGWPNLIYLWITMGGIKLVHELGHGLACHRFGCRCHSIGVALIIFSPTMYCDATDSWMLKNKWKRIFIASAGMYVEVVLSAFAILMWSILQPGLLQNLCLNVFFISTLSTVIFNANPLIKFDGYYILSDVLEIPNLREKSRTTIQRAAAWTFGLKLPTNPFQPKSAGVLFGSYAVAATIYGWFILFSIGAGLYQVLKPHRLESIGATLGLLVVLSSIVGLSKNTWKTVQSSRNEPTNRSRLLVTLFLLSAAILGAVCIPFPLYVRAPFVLEARDSRSISAIAPGRLESVLVSAGERVNKGDVIVRLMNEDIQERIASLSFEVRAAESKLQVHDLLAENEEYAVAQDTVRRLEKEIFELTKMEAALLIRAPCDGIVCAAPRQPTIKKENITDLLPTWTGTPLNSFNIGAYLDSGTLVCSISPVADFDAVLLLDQHDRQDVSVGQTVRLLCEAFPLKILNGEVSEISQRHLEFAPRSLTNKLGGELTTITDVNGQERLSSHAYQIRIPLENRSDLPRVAMRGHAKILASRRSATQWLWRFARQTFLFRL